MLKFDKVSFKYPDGTLALNNVTFEIESSEFVFLIGHTGAGKTTLLRLILGDLKPTKGEVFIEDKNIGLMKDWERQLLRQQVGVIFQGLNLIPELNVRENLYLKLELSGVKKNDLDSKVAKALKKVGMLAKRDHFPSQLSGGERQKIALARAILLDPIMIFADEPTGNLDPASSLEVIEAIAEVNKQEDILVVIATHDNNVVNKMKKRVIALEKGKIVSDKRKGVYVTN